MWSVGHGFDIDIVTSLSEICAAEMVMSSIEVAIDADDA